MARPEPKKLTKQQKNRLKDPKFALALKVVGPLQAAKRRKPTR